MSVVISVDKIKSMLLPELTSTTSEDATIEEILNAVINEVIEYLDDTSITGRATIPTACEWPMMKQIAYEFRRRKDPGLQSVTFPDGSIQKFGDGAFNRHLQETMDRRRRLHIGG